MPNIICTLCGKATEVEELQGDYSTYVCSVCSDKANLEAWKKEAASLESKTDRTESEDRRLEFLKAKIASLQG